MKSATLNSTSGLKLPNEVTTTVGIVGSHYWSDYDTFQGVMLVIPEAAACGAVVSGGARGVDEMAERWAKETGRYFQGYPPLPDRRPFTVRAHERNQRIVDHLDECRRKGHTVALIAMPGPKSRGTYDTIRRAERQGIKVIRWEVPE